jgi:hypothetical protein
MGQLEQLLMQWGNCDCKLSTAEAWWAINYNNIDLAADALC